MTLRSALYAGSVAHCRMRPRRHAFRYRCYWMLFDIDELPALDGRLRWFSYNKRNLFSFHDRDHGSGEGKPLRPEIESHLHTAGIDLEGGSIRVLCMPRVMGFVFNPLSVLFCYGCDGDLRAILYEVHNTFRQRHSYLIAVPRDNRRDRSLVQSSAKRFYVSPFMDMAMAYRFTVRPPSQDVSVVIRGDDAEGVLILASLAGTRRELDDGTLLSTFASIPFVTANVVAAIHWQALRLWLKGVRLVPRPEPPVVPVTSIKSMETALAD